MNTLLESDWLLRMLAKASRKPDQRLLALFDVLEDTLTSPLTRQQPMPQYRTPPAVLLTFLSDEAHKAGASMPDMLANQLYFMAISACQETITHPRSPALAHAKQAANALIKAQTTREVPWRAVRNYALVCIGVGLGLLTGWQLHLQGPFTDIIAISPATLSQPHPAEPAMLPLSQEASPAETAAIYNRLETMKHGDCRFLEALQLPERLKSVYIENVVQGHVTSNRAEQVLVNQLLDQVKCNYTPMLMMRSK